MSQPQDHGPEGKSRHTCEHCNETFGRKQERERHVDGVHGLPKRCSVLNCGHEVKRRDRMQAHLEKKHRFTREDAVAEARRIFAAPNNAAAAIMQTIGSPTYSAFDNGATNSLGVPGGPQVDTLAYPIPHKSYTLSSSPNAWVYPSNTQQDAGSSGHANLTQINDGKDGGLTSMDMNQPPTQ